MSKPILGLALGGVLGVLDGLTALFSPEAAPFMTAIMIGSIVKGLVAGILIGYLAKKVGSLPLAIVLGLAVGLILAFAVAAMPSPDGKHHYFAILLPGGILGLIVGFATHKFGKSSADAQVAASSH